MPSTATTRNRLEKQGTGENVNTWGTKLNATGLDLIDAMVDGRATYTLSGSKTLTSNNYAADEARMVFQDITSGTGGTVTIPSVEKRYLVRNNTSGSVIFTTGSGATATITSGSVAAVACDATNCYLAQITDFGAATLKSTGTPTVASHLTTKTYVDSTVAAAAFSPVTLGTGVATFLTTPSSANLLAAMTDETGTGANVFATSPTLVMPLLGTPTSGIATNLTGLPLTTGVTGTLPVANGGTGVTTSTGTGNSVLSASPTFTGTLAAAAITASGTLSASGVVSSVGIRDSGSVLARFEGSGVSVPAGSTGLGLELFSSGGQAIAQAYNRSTLAEGPLRLTGSSIALAANTSVTGTLTATGRVDMGDRLVIKSAAGGVATLNAWVSLRSDNNVERGYVGYATGSTAATFNNTLGAIVIQPSNTTVGSFSSTGLAVTGTLSATGLASVGGSTPASAAAAGVAGTVTWDASYIYICTATNTWKRVAIATW